MTASRSEPLARVSWDLLGTRIVVEGPREPVSRFHDFYRPLSEASNGDVGTVRRVRLRRSDGKWRLTESGQDVFGGRTVEDVLLLSIRWMMRQYLRALPPGSLGVHAAGWIRDGTSWMVCGTSDAGKTTAAYRLLEPDDRFLSDECVVLCPPEARIHGFPRPLNLPRNHEPSRRTFRHFTLTDSSGRTFYYAQLRRANLPPEPIETRNRVVVFLDRRPGDDRLESLSQGDGVARLLRLTLYPSEPRERFQRFDVGDPDTVRFFRLRYSEIDQAQHLLRTRL